MGKLRTSRSVFLLKTFLLVVGTIFAYLANSSGEIAEDLYNSSSVISLHETFAEISIGIYLILSIVYLAQFIRIRNWNIDDSKSALIYRIPLFDRIWKDFQKITLYIYNIRFAIILLAILGFISLGITGALGGIISHGPDSDFITQFIYNLFF